MRNEYKEQLFFTREEVAKILRMSVRSLDRRIAEGLIDVPAVNGERGVRALLIHRDALKAAIEARRRREI